MDVERLREFLVFAQKMNFTTAAAELHMAQPNLSKHIRALENEVGTTLVVRGGLGSANTLTPAGVRFCEFADNMVAAYDTLVDDCHEIAAQDPPVRIQDVRHIVNVIPQLRAMLGEDYPQRTGFSYVRMDGVPLDALESGDVDFVVMIKGGFKGADVEAPQVSDAYALVALQPETVVAFVNSASPHFSKTSMRLSDLAGLQLMGGDTPFFAHVRESLGETLASANCPVTFRVVSDRPKDGDAYPMRPTDINVCTSRFAKYYQDLDVEDIQILTFEGVIPLMYPYLICKRDNPSPVVQKLIELSRTIEVER